MSHVLALAARGSLALALLTFVLGNLAVLRLVRREVALARLRRDFVDVVSHELRTPLAALSLKAEMLAAGDVPPTRVAHYLSGLNTDVRRLNEQVQRILDFARLEKGAPLRRDTLPARAQRPRPRAGRSGGARPSRSRHRERAGWRRLGVHALSPGRERVGGVVAEVDLAGHCVQRHGATVRLLPKEAELLTHLLRHRGATCSRDDLLRAVWGYDATPTTRTVDTHMFQLRQKIENDPAQPQVLLTVHGVGYRLV